MAITFAVRGDSLEARYSNEGKVPGAAGSNAPAEVTTDQAGINGSTSIDLAGAFLTQRPLIYAGRTNTPSNRPRSVLMRVKFASLSSQQGLFHLGVMGRNPYNSLFGYVTSGGEVVAGGSNDAGQDDDGTSSGANLTNIADDAGSAEWHDIVVTWTGTTDANGLEVWVDGSRVLQDTMIRELPSPYSENQQLACANIMVGTTGAIVNAHFYLDELVVFDEVITPTSVTLTSGAGSLSGDARTAYVEVDAFDGTASTGGGGSAAGLGIPGLR